MTHKEDGQKRDGQKRDGMTRRKSRLREEAEAQLAGAPQTGESIEERQQAGERLRKRIEHDKPETAR